MDDPELEQTKEDTAQIFVQYAKLLSKNNSPSEKVAASTDERCTQNSTREVTATEREATIPQLTRSKSRDATAKDVHPKVLRSVKPSSTVQVVDGHHCRASGKKSPSPPEQQSSNTISISSPLSGTADHVRPRPDSLLPLHRRNPSSDGSGKSTPAQDPPMDLVLSPVADIAASFPPMASSSMLLQGANSPRREGLVQSAEHCVRSVAEPTSQLARSLYEKRACEPAAAAIVDSDPRGVKARMIADRLKHIGDVLEQEHMQSQLDDVMTAVSEVVVQGSNPMQVMYDLCTRSELSWRKVVEIFQLLYRVSKYDDEFTLFEKVWYCLLDKIVPWIQDNGGWSAFLRVNSPSCHANTPNVVRRHPVPAQSEPVLIDLAMPTSHHPHLPSCVHRSGVADSHVPIGRMAMTPQMPRHAHGEQSSPCLSRSYTQSASHMAEASRRHRVWSLTERGSFQREDGVEDIERSISELDIEGLEDEEDAFANSQEEAREEEEEAQVGDRTLTSTHLHSALPPLVSTSPPISVPSPHSSSQPETGTADDHHSDSGIENLSLSCSPPRVNFSLGGGVGYRQSPMLHARNQTSLTSLSSAASAASASPIHTSPSSRKNSSSNGNGGSGYFNSRSRPRSSGSLKESNHRQGGGCYRTGSLTRPRPSVATPTNATPTHVSSSHHAHWAESPGVRQVSTTPYEIYELVKGLFRSP